MLFEQKKLRSKLRNLSVDLADAAYESSLVRAEIVQVRQANHAVESANIRLVAERDEAFAERGRAIVERDQIAADRGRVLTERDKTLTELDQMHAERDQVLEERNRARLGRDEIRIEFDQCVADKIALAASFEQAVRERDAAAAQHEAARAEQNILAGKVGMLEQELAKAIKAYADLDQTYKASLAEHSHLAEQLGHSLRALQESSAQNVCHVRTPYYYLGDGRGLTHLSTGQPFFVATNDRSITPWILMGGVWETFADDVVTAYVVPGMSILDVGANMGYYTVKWGSLIGPGGVLHAFEPNPEVLDLLRANVSINALAFTCHVHAVAAGSAPGHGTLTFNYANMGQAGFDQNHLVDRKYEVVIETIDNRLSSLERVDLFKIDAEGFEPEVLRGAKKLISRSPNCAFHIEIQLSWERFGSVASILKPIITGRRLFVICHDKTLMPIELAQLASYVRQTPHKMADLFICPDSNEFISRVTRFIVAKYVATKPARNSLNPPIFSDRRPDDAPVRKLRRRRRP